MLKMLALKPVRFASDVKNVLKNRKKCHRNFFCGPDNKKMTLNIMPFLLANLFFISCSSKIAFLHSSNCNVHVDYKHCVGVKMPLTIHLLTLKCCCT